MCARVFVTVCLCVSLRLSVCVFVDVCGFLSLCDSVAHSPSYSLTLSLSHSLSLTLSRSLSLSHTLSLHLSISHLSSLSCHCCNPLGPFSNPRSTRIFFDGKIHFLKSQDEGGKRFIFPSTLTCLPPDLTSLPPLHLLTTAGFFIKEDETPNQSTPPLPLQHKPRMVKTLKLIHIPS